MSEGAVKHEEITCECCDAVFPTYGNDDADEYAFAAGWKFGWDGWICPKCDGDIPETVH